MDEDTPDVVRLASCDDGDQFAVFNFDRDQQQTLKLVPSAAARTAGSAIVGTAAPAPVNFTGGGIEPEPRPGNWTGSIAGSADANTAPVPHPEAPARYPVALRSRGFEVHVSSDPPLGEVHQLRLPADRDRGTTGGRSAGRGASRRSSAKSGDSGEDGEPGPQRLESQGEIERWLDDRRRTLAALTAQLTFGELAA